jgi:hypothetical protein
MGANVLDQRGCSEGTLDRSRLIYRRDRSLREIDLKS